MDHLKRVVRLHGHILVTDLFQYVYPSLVNRNICAIALFTNEVLVEHVQHIGSINDLEHGRMDVLLSDRQVITFIYSIKYSLEHYVNLLIEGSPVEVVEGCVELEVSLDVL